MLLNDFPLTWPFFFSFFFLFPVFFFSCPFAQLFRQYLHQSFLLSRAGDFGSASLAGRDCSASGLDDAPSGLTNEFRVRFPLFSLSLSLFITPLPPFPAQPPATNEKISAHRIGLLRGLSSWRQNRKTLRKRVNNDFSFLLQNYPIPPPTRLLPRQFPPFAFGRRAVKTQRSTKIITKQSTLNIAYSARQEQREYIPENDNLSLSFFPFLATNSFMTFFWWCNGRNNQKIMANSSDLVLSFVDPICRDWYKNKRDHNLLIRYRYIQILYKHVCLSYIDWNCSPARYGFIPMRLWPFSGMFLCSTQQFMADIMGTRGV